MKQYETCPNCGGRKESNFGELSGKPLIRVCPTCDGEGQRLTRECLETILGKAEADNAALVVTIQQIIERSNAGKTLPQIDSSVASIGRQALAVDHPGDALQKEIEHLRKAKAVLDDIYPMVAGQAILLQNAGETKAAEDWNKIAKQIYNVLANPPKTRA